MKKLESKWEKLAEGKLTTCYYCDAPIGKDSLTGECERCTGDTMGLKSNGRNKFFNFSDGTSVRFTQDARSKRVWAFLYYRGEVVSYMLYQFRIQSWKMQILKKMHALWCRDFIEKSGCI